MQKAPDCIQFGPWSQLPRRAEAYPFELSGGMCQRIMIAIPQADPGKRIGRLRLGGEPRSPIDPDPGVCRFYGRCPTGMPRCAEEMPALREAGPARQVACHFA